MTNIAIENDPFIVSFPIKHETCSIAVAFCKRLPEGTPPIYREQSSHSMVTEPQSGHPRVFPYPQHRKHSNA